MVQIRLNYLPFLLNKYTESVSVLLYQCIASPRQHTDNKTDESLGSDASKAPTRYFIELAVRTTWTETMQIVLPMQRFILVDFF